MADSLLDVSPITATWLKEPDWSENVSSSGVFSKMLIQYGGSVGQLWKENDEIPRRLQMQFSFDDKQEETEFLNFFETQKGRWGKFWVPTWITQFRPVDDIASSQTIIPVYNDKFAGVYRGHERLFIMLHNGDKLVRKIIAAEESIGGETETITLSSSLGVSADLSNIAIMGLFLLVRFDQDKVDMKYTTNTVSETTLQFYELIREYP